MLLLRYDGPAPLGVHWLTPGGGIDPGETAGVAALRELREETGWTDVLLGEELGPSSRPLPNGLLQHEVHFAARVDEPRRPLSADGHDADGITAWDWFDELPDEQVWPDALPAYLARLRG